MALVVMLGIPSQASVAQAPGGAPPGTGGPPGPAGAPSSSGTSGPSAPSGAPDPADAAARREVTLERPIEVRAKTASGTIVRGLVERWDVDGFTGAFGTRRWDEFAPIELNRIYRMLMDDRNALQWLTLGERLLEQQGGDSLADNAFNRAKRLDRSIDPAIDAARKRATERRRILAEQRLRDILPSGDDFDATPWPILSDETQRAAIEEMKRDAERIMRDAGAKLPLFETKYFLLYSELSQRETVRWANQLDGMYEMVMQLFHVEAGLNLFWGKAVVFIWPSRDRFRVVEASAFGQRVPEGVVGLCHMKDAKVFVNSFRGSDELEFTAVLLHETTHGIMHRYLTPRRLPTWANEGFAERIAHIAMVRANLRSPVDKLRRAQGVQYIRQSGDIARIMRMNYRDGTWPGENAVGYAVGYVLCNFMLDVVPRLAPARGKDRFKDWVVAIKGGKAWDKALAEDFGFPMETIAAEAVKWFRTND